MNDLSRIHFEAADLTAYLDRIGYSGPVAADLATLRALQGHQLASLAFENLDPLFRRTPDLSAAGLIAKLVRGGRGGYCYEQNNLLLGMLQRIGFDAHGLMGRVRWGSPADNLTPRSHMMIHVTLPDGPYLVDAGFGGMTPTGPLRFVPDIVQETPHEPFRLLHEGPSNGGDWLLQAEVAGTWNDIYRFDLNPQIPIDYKASNYYLANSDESFFRQGVIAARHVPGKRMALGNGSFTVYPTGQAPQRHALGDGNAVCDVLEREFGIRLPDRVALIAYIDAKASG